MEEIDIEIRFNEFEIKEIKKSLVSTIITIIVILAVLISDVCFFYYGFASILTLLTIGGLVTLFIMEITMLFIVAYDYKYAKARGDRLLTIKDACGDLTMLSYLDKSNNCKKK